jgi:hypothetical protein
MDWSTAYVTAQKMVEQKLGNIILPEDELRLINTYVRYALSNDIKPDPKAIYFAIYDQLPPAYYGQPANVLETIKACRKVQGKAPISSQEEEQINLLSAVTGMVCSSALEKGSLSTSVSKSGCAAMLFTFGGLSALSYFLSRYLI